MQNLKNIAVGFLVSFLGSIPLGYLNVIGFEIYKRRGFVSTTSYLSGVICIEFFVIYFTLIFANKLAANQKLTKYIEGFSIVFMFVLAVVFYMSAGNSSSNGLFDAIYLDTTPFLLGLFLSATNVVQIPFWTSWNLYLLNGKYIEVSQSGKYFYVFGTVAGTFCGMLLLILSLHYFASNVEFLSKYLMKVIIPLVFVGLGIFNAIKFYRKYYGKISLN